MSRKTISASGQDYVWRSKLAGGRDSVIASAPVAAGRTKKPAT